MELLSPAGSPACALAAFDAGADAVYAGLSKFNARERGENFTADIDTTQYDTLISVDIATKRLLGKYGDIFENFENTVSIDHHGSRSLKAKALYCETHSSSCSELIFKFAKVLKAKITPEIANYLFAGIVGDTACFEHDNVTPQTHLIASKLYEYGLPNSIKCNSKALFTAYTSSAVLFPIMSDS